MPSSLWWNVASARHAGCQRTLVYPRDWQSAKVDCSTCEPSFASAVGLPVSSLWPAPGTPTGANVIGRQASPAPITTVELASLLAC